MTALYPPSTRFFAAIFGNEPSALAGAGIYDNEAAGRAAVADGYIFAAISASTEGYIDLWKKVNAGSSTLLKTYPSLAAFEQVVEDAAAELAAASVSAITVQKALSIAAVAAQQTTSVNAVNTAGTTQTDAVNLAGATQVSAVNAAGDTQAARVLNTMPEPMYPSTAAALSNGVASCTFVAGSGGTNGTYTIAATGGGGTGALALVTVASGAISNIRMLSRGYNYTSAPSFSTASITGLTGGSITAQLAVNEPPGEFFAVSVTDAGVAYDIFENVAGTATLRNRVYTAAGLPIPLYTNTGGTGDRTASITVTTSAGLRSSGTDSNLVDGGTANNATDSLAFAAVSVSGAFITFDFGPGASKVVQEVTWKQGTTASHGTWKWQAGDDGTNYIDVGTSFTLGGATTQTQTSMAGNTKGYRYYRLLGVSGTASGAPFIQEVEFKLDGGQLDAVARIPAGGARNQVPVKASATSFDIAWANQRGDLFAGLPSSVHSLWTFDELTGSSVTDRIGTVNLSLVATGTPTYTWTASGLRLQSGVAEMPSQSVRGAFVVYRTTRNASGGFLVSGGPSGSGSGVLEDSVTHTYTHHVGGGFGVHTPTFRASNGTNAFEYNRGGWLLAFVDYGSLAASVLGFGGRHSATTSRCAMVEIAAAGVFNAALSDTERALIYNVMRRALRPRGIFLSVDDCPARQDVVILHGESNPHGDELLSNFTAGDQALTFSNVSIQNVGSTTVGTNNARPWLLQIGLNQRLTDVARAGPEIGLAKRWRANFSTRRRPLVILKATLGSTFMVPVGTGSAIASNSWSPTDTASASLFYFALLRGLYDMEQALRNEAVGVNICGITQNIGLNDAVNTTNTTDAATYQGYRQAFFTSFLAFTGLASVRAVIFRTHNADPASNATALTHVRTAEAALVTANSTTMVLVDTDAYGKQVGDAAHFDAAGTMALGEAAYDQLNTMGVFA